MARRRQTDDTDEAQEEREEKVISQRKLKQLLKDAGASYKDSREIAGALGNKVRTAIEHDGLHKKAFSTLVGMERMTPEKLAEYWETLQYYVETSGLADRAKSAPRLRLVADADAQQAAE